jgi:hypothetical protein
VSVWTAADMERLFAAMFQRVQDPRLCSTAFSRLLIETYMFGPGGPSRYTKRFDAWMEANPSHDPQEFIRRSGIQRRSAEIRGILDRLMNMYICALPFLMLVIAC